MDATIARLEALIEPGLESMGYDLVRVMLMGGAKRRILQIMAERRDRQGMRVEDCAEISRYLSTLLDVEYPLRGAYALEVSSPGLDRPLVRERDFIRFEGFEAKIETARPIDGRRRFRGRLGAVANGVVAVASAGIAHAIPLEDIEKARLVVTDEILAAAPAVEDVAGDGDVELEVSN